MFKAFRYLYRKVDRKTEKRLWLYAAFGFLSPVINLFGITAIIPILNNIMNRTASDRDMYLSFGMAILMLFSGFFDIWSARLGGKLSYEGSHVLSMKLYELTEKEDLLSHNDRDIMTAVSLVRTDAIKCLELLKSCVSSIVNGVMLVLFLVVMVAMDGLPGFAIAIFVFAEMLFMYVKNAKRMQEYGEKIRETDIQANGQITTAYGAYKELKVEEDCSNFRERFEEYNLSSADLKISMNNRNAVVGVLMRNVIYMLMFLALAAVMLLSVDITSYISQIIVTVMLVIRILPLGNRVVSSINTIKSSEKSYRCVREGLEKLEALLREEEHLADIRTVKASFTKGLTVRDLSFSYPNGKVIFDHAEMDIPVRSSVAVVGPSGAGKTTFLDIILGLLPPQSGSIKYDEYDIVAKADENGPCRANIGSIVSYIPQAVYMNGATVRENVAFFERSQAAGHSNEGGRRSNLKGTDNADNQKDMRIKECLREACILEDVMAMPEQLDTLIGAGGTNISGGQRQRIALARALYKNFEILIMDEATSALDSDTERAVVESIRRVQKDKTLIMVTHHDMIADICDIVYRIGDGKITRVR